MAKSTVSRRKNKPKKPYPDFPLFPHATGRWAKKIRQKFHYFGKVADDPDGTKALEQLNREWAYLKDGRTPPSVDTEDGCKLHLLCNLFLTAKRNKIDAGELTPRSFQDYYEICDVLISHFGRERLIADLRSDDFASLRKAMARRWGPVRLRNTITRVRMLFKFAIDERLIEHPTHYGQSFSPPSAKTLRKARNDAGPRLFAADELHKILDAAGPAMKAMILLGLNCGLGNTDCATLPQSAVNLVDGWIDFPRPKTQICRHIPLWAITVDALKTAIVNRPKPKDQADDDLCFLTIRGTRLVRITPKKLDDSRYSRRDQISVRFGNLLKKLSINGRKGLGFYTLRHVFATVAGESRDQVAVNALMGHVDSSMAGVYRERISDERLIAVTDVVRRWLWPESDAPVDSEATGGP